MDKKPILLNKNWTTLLAYFALPLTKEDYLDVKNDETRDKKLKILFEGFNEVNILTFGSPVNVSENYFKDYINEKLIKDRWHNHSNFFTSNRLEEQPTNERYLVQSTLTSKEFILEILEYCEQDYVIIVSVPLKSIKDHETKYTTTHRLVRKGYTFRH